jgi:hypothetical protein
MHNTTTTRRKGLTFPALHATGWTPQADDLHDDLFAPETGEVHEVKGVYATTDRTPGFERGRGSYR